jgi:hypothetical protein
MRSLRLAISEHALKEKELIQPAKSQIEIRMASGENLLYMWWSVGAISTINNSE